MLEVDERTHRARAGEPGERSAIETGELRLRGIEAARREAARVGDRRRELRLVHRAHRVGGELSDLRSRERARDRSASLIHRSEDQRRERGVPHASGDRAAREQWLDHQASLARGESTSGERREYRRLAALAGLSEQEYEALAPGESRRVRVVVDQALRDREPSTNEPRDPGPGHRAVQVGEALRRVRERHGRGPRTPDGEVARRRARQFGRPQSQRERP